MYWVFTEEQLKAALADFVEYSKRNGTTEEAVATFEVNLFRFLTSTQAREHKLQGGASFTPEEAG